MQVLAGDIDLAEETFGAFFSLWQRFGLLPERFTLDIGLGGQIHPTEQYYPLRPELVESAFYLHEVCTIAQTPPPLVHIANCPGSADTLYALHLPACMPKSFCTARMH